ncbi:MAG: choice-of-anchor J domain-containing protein, partial [Dolichospermum sp.]
ASCGITAIATGADNFISVNALNTSATVSKTVETTSINTKPANGLTFTFMPGVLPAQDVQVQGWLNLPPVGCHNTTQSVTVRLKNSGSAVINASAVSLNLTSTGANTGINLTSSNSASIAAGATSDITFTGLNLNTAGATSLRAVATLASDPVRTNDTGRITVNTATTTSTFPVSESAETSPFKFGWLRTLAGTNAWTVVNEIYRFRNINGVAFDSIPPQDGSNFFLFNNYNAAAGTRVVLHSDCFTLPALTPGREHDISFWLSHDTSFINEKDSIYVVVSTDRGQNWTRIKGFQRYSQFFTVPDWKDETVLISAYAGQTIQLGFEGVSKFGNGIGLDNIVVKANLTLPVTLTSFTGKKEGNNNILSWTTA